MLNSQNGLLMTPQLQKGANLDSLITLYGLKEIITESTNILEHFSTCIDLLFTIQQALVDTLEYIPLFTQSAFTRSFFKLNLKIE